MWRLEQIVDRLNLRKKRKISECNVFSIELYKGLLSFPACYRVLNSRLTETLSQTALQAHSPQLTVCQHHTWKCILLRHQSYKQLGEVQANIRLPKRVCGKGREESESKPKSINGEYQQPRKEMAEDHYEQLSQEAVLEAGPQAFDTGKLSK